MVNSSALAQIHCISIFFHSFDAIGQPFLCSIFHIVAKYLCIIAELELKLVNAKFTTLMTAGNTGAVDLCYTPYAIPHVTNVKRIVDGNPDTSPPF